MSPYLTDYLFYSSENAAHKKLHNWARLFVMSVALSRRCWFKQGDWTIYPSMYVFFVGDPGDCKSVAMGLAQKLVHDFTDVEIAPDQVTKEALTEFMGDPKNFKDLDVNGKVFKYMPITVFANELVDFLGMEPTNMIRLLTSLYDCPMQHRIGTKNKGKDYIEAPYLTLLGCITTETIGAFMAQKLITGGFSRRLIPVFSPGRGRAKSEPTMTHAHYAAKARCALYCREVQALKGQFTMDEEAREFWRHWFDNIKEPAYFTEVNNIMKAWHGSKDTPLLKLSMCLSAANSLDMVIKKEHLVEALRMLDETEPDMLTLLGGGGRNELAPIIRRIEKMIQEESPREVTDKRIKLLLNNMATDEEIMSCLRHLVDVEAISERAHSGDKGMTRFYKLNQPST